MRTQYYYCSPRGFANEFLVYKITDTADMPEVRARCQRSYDESDYTFRRISAREARELMAYSGDASTEDYSSYQEGLSTWY